jgi:hypothetical protein
LKAADVDPWGVIRKSHKESEEEVVVAKSGARIDGFQAILVIRLSNSEGLEKTPPLVVLARSIPNRPINGLGLCPLASQINTPDPLVAAKYSKERDEGLFIVDDVLLLTVG